MQVVKLMSFAAFNKQQLLYDVFKIQEDLVQEIMTYLLFGERIRKFDNLSVWLMKYV